MRALGKGQDAMRREHDLVFAVRAMQVDFRLPARLDDALPASVVLRECRRASLVIDQEIRRDGVPLPDATVGTRPPAAAGFRPRALPPALYVEPNALEAMERSLSPTHHPTPPPPALSRRPRQDQYQ